MQIDAIYVFDIGAFRFYHVNEEKELAAEKSMQGKRGESRMMGIGIGTELQIEYADQKIIIKIPDEACQLCGSNHDLISYNGSNICRACVKKLQAVLEKDK